MQNHKDFKVITEYTPFDFFSKFFNALRDGYRLDYSACGVNSVANKPTPVSYSVTMLLGDGDRKEFKVFGHVSDVSAQVVSHELRSITEQMQNAFTQGFNAGFKLEGVVPFIVSLQKVVEAPQSASETTPVGQDGEASENVTESLVEPLEVPEDDNQGTEQESVQKPRRGRKPKKEQE